MFITQAQMDLFLEGYAFLPELESQDALKELLQKGYIRYVPLCGYEVIANIDGELIDGRNS